MEFVYFPLKTVRYLLDWVFPAYCDCCGSLRNKEELLCDECRRDLQSMATLVCCSRCGKPLFGVTESPEECPECRGKRLYLDEVGSLYLNKGKAHELVLLLKYTKGLHLARLFGEELAGHCLKKGRYSNHIIVPVPQSMMSRFKRGYNQAEEIARVLAKRAGLPHALIFSKSLTSRSQTQMNKRDRWTVNRGTIRIRRKYLRRFQASPQFLLIDDVYTTGATLNECARVLKKSFPKSRVSALTVLRS